MGTRLCGACFIGTHLGCTGMAQGNLVCNCVPCMRTRDDIELPEFEVPVMPEPDRQGALL